VGLRINTNVGALTALRTLQRTSGLEARTFERLATGVRINRASDSPSGLLIVERLRSELSAIRQAVDNTQTASNLVRTADAALGQVSDRLVDLRANAVAALNTGVNGNGALKALQQSIDQGLLAIDRVAATTRFADQPLLNGNLGFRLDGVSPELTRIDVQGGQFPSGFPAQVTVNVTAAATRAQAVGTISAAPQPAASTIRIIGNRGQEDLSVAAGATQADVIAQINAVSETTGVEATPGGIVRSIDYGSTASVNVQELGGDLVGITPGLTQGTDIAGTINGITAGGRGNVLQVSDNALGAEVTVQAGAAGAFQFRIVGGGAQFQVGPVAGGLNDLTIGIGSVSTSTLGEGSGLGALSTLATGGANSLLNRPAGALSVLDAAQSQVSSLRARLGAVSSQVFDTNIRALDVAFENLSASRSRIQDTDFAEEIASAVRNRLARETGLAALRQSNLNAGLALRLLG
jgi:flagellin